MANFPLRFGAVVLCAHLHACASDSTTAPGSDQSSSTTTGSVDAMDNRSMTSAQTTTASCRFKASADIGVVCQEYRGNGDLMARAANACEGLPESTLSPEACPRPTTAVECVTPILDGVEVSIVWAEATDAVCDMALTDCSMAAGQLSGASACEARAPVAENNNESAPLPGVFQPFEYLCEAPLDDSVGATDGNVCTWQAIGGCTEPGRKFWDYAACEPVLTQRPYYPVPPSAYQTPEDDPIHQDEAFLAELEWVKDEAEACGCVCCHTESQTPSGASMWDTEAPGIWTDSFTNEGLATAAGWIDSSALGAFDAGDNNGFDRTKTVLPTTDVNRMVAFFESELKRRGLDRSDFEASTPIGGPLYQQMVYEPSACENGEGVMLDGTVVWQGGEARYIYVLEASAKAPTVPPNLDTPMGTIWRLNVSPTVAGLSSGVSYGTTPTGTVQAVPQEGNPTELVAGETYFLVTMRDIGVPLTRCLFEYGNATDGLNDMMAPEPTPEPPPREPTSGNEPIDAGNWNESCQTSDDCVGPADFCARQPGSDAGYCTINCNTNAVCRAANAPSDWTCNAIACDIEAFTWCGPSSEIESSGGFLRVCE